jgi:hypothetical protein
MTIYYLLFSSYYQLIELTVKILVGIYVTKERWFNGENVILLFRKRSSLS